jgi:hypothetical protein
MRFYLAAPSSYQSLMRTWRRDLLALNHTVTSRWLDRELTGVLIEGPHMETWAVQDVEDVVLADVVLNCTLEPIGPGGRHSAFGMGLAFGKNLVIVGPREHIFHFMPQVAVYVDWTTFLLSQTPTVQWREARRVE